MSEAASESHNPLTKKATPEITVVPSRMASEDAGVERTNDDATECKCSAVKLGYYDDKCVLPTTRIN